MSGENSFHKQYLNYYSSLNLKTIAKRKFKSFTLETLNTQNILFKISRNGEYIEIQPSEIQLTEIQERKTLRRKRFVKKCMFLSKKNKAKRQNSRQKSNESLEKNSVLSFLSWFFKKAIYICIRDPHKYNHILLLAQIYMDL